MNTPIYTDLSGKSAVVTGAGEGIGYAIAEALLRQGANVVLNDINPDACTRAVTRLRRTGPGQVVACAGDAADPAFIKAFVEECLTRFGSVELVVANAGVTMFGSFLDFAPASFDRVMAVNLRGPYFLVQEAARAMQRLGHGGRVVVMGSNIGVQSYPQLSAYGMSKAALAMMSRALVPELAPLGITLNTLAPGATVTERTRLEQDDYGGAWGELIPRGQAAVPDDIARMCLFLLSEASAHLVGQTLVVDGGWTATSPLPQEASSAAVTRGDKVKVRSEE